MHELIDPAKLEWAIALLAALALPAGLTCGAWLGWARGQMRWYLTRGIALGLLGPVVYAVWRYYRWMVRIDPETGYVGLHKSSVLFLNVLVFVVFGAVVGLIYGRILRHGRESTNHR